MTPPQVRCPPEVAWMYDLLPEDLRDIVEHDPTTLEWCLCEAERRILVRLGQRQELREKIHKDECCN